MTQIQSGLEPEIFNNSSLSDPRSDEEIEKIMSEIARLQEDMKSVTDLSFAQPKETPVVENIKSENTLLGSKNTSLLESYVQEPNKISLPVEDKIIPAIEKQLEKSQPLEKPQEGKMELRKVSSPSPKEENTPQMNEKVVDTIASHLESMLTMMVKGNMSIKLCSETGNQFVQISFLKDVIRIQLSNGTDLRVPVTNSL